jgi:hypothetical protein
MCPFALALVLAAPGPREVPPGWRFDPFPVTRPDGLNDGLPVRWEKGAVHVLAWETVADDYWKSETTQALAVKHFDRPVGDAGHRWALALVYHHPFDVQRPWRGKERQFAPGRTGEPGEPTDAQLWGYELYRDRPTAAQVATFLDQAGWDARLGQRVGLTRDVGGETREVTITRTVVAGGLDAAAWKRVLQRDPPARLFRELRAAEEYK